MLDAGLLSKTRKVTMYLILRPGNADLWQKRRCVNAFAYPFWPEDDVSNHLAEAKENFENVEIAQMLKTYEI